MRWVNLGTGITAGFTTRCGGTSTGPYAHFNLGAGVGDDPARVSANRALLSQALGAPVTFATQVHGNAVLTVDAPAVDPSAECQSAGALSAGGALLTVGEADALVTARPQVGLAVTAADCVPVVAADWRVGVIGVAHAGRAGFLQGVIDALLRAMAAAGALTVRAVVGPCICGPCYEVAPAMAQQAAALVPAAACTTRRGKTGIDLRAGVSAQLQAGGASVSHVRECTYESPDFYSHRAATHHGTTPTGRFAGVIVRRTDNNSSAYAACLRR